MIIDTTQLVTNPEQYLGPYSKESYENLLTGLSYAPATVDGILLENLPIFKALQPLIALPDDAPIRFRHVAQQWSLRVIAYELSRGDDYATPSAYHIREVLAERLSEASIAFMTRCVEELLQARILQYETRQTIDLERQPPDLSEAAYFTLTQGRDTVTLPITQVEQQLALAMEVELIQALADIKSWIRKQTDEAFWLETLEVDLDDEYEKERIGNILKNIIGM